MNLQRVPVARPTTENRTTGYYPVSDVDVATRVTAKRAELAALLATETTALQVACAAAERIEFSAPSAVITTDYSGEITRRVQRITELEGQIEYYDRALTVLDPD